MKPRKRACSSSSPRPHPTSRRTSANEPTDIAKGLAKDGELAGNRLVVFAKESGVPAVEGGEFVERGAGIGVEKTVNGAAGDAIGAFAAVIGLASDLEEFFVALVAADRAVDLDLMHRNTCSRITRGEGTEGLLALDERAVKMARAVSWS